MQNDRSQFESVAAPTRLARWRWWAFVIFSGLVCISIHRNGDDAAALSDISQILYLESVSDDPGPVTSRLVAIGICALASQRIREMALGLQCDTPASREQIRKLMTAMLDDASRKVAINRAGMAERMVTLNNALFVGEKTYWRRGEVDRIALRMMDDCDAMRKQAWHRIIQRRYRCFPSPAKAAGIQKLQSSAKYSCPRFRAFHGPNSEY